MRRSFAVGIAILLSGGSIAAHPLITKAPYVARCMAKLQGVNGAQVSRGQRTYSRQEWARYCEEDYAAAEHIANEKPYDADLSCFPLAVSPERCREIKAAR